MTSDEIFDQIKNLDKKNVYVIIDTDFSKEIINKLIQNGDNVHGWKASPLTENEKDRILNIEFSKSFSDYCIFRSSDNKYVAFEDISYHITENGLISHITFTIDNMIKKLEEYEESLNRG